LYGSRGIMISGDLNSNLIPAMKKNKMNVLTFELE